jgi:hypothetical protein
VWVWGLFTAPQGHGERNIRGGFPRGCDCPFLQLATYFCLPAVWLGTLHSFQHVLPRAWLGKTIVFLTHRETDKETLTRKRCWVFALVTVSVRAGQLRANDMIVFIYLTGLRKNGIFEPFVYKNDHFTKTGSGQT